MMMRQMSSRVWLLIWPPAGSASSRPARLRTSSSVIASTRARASFAGMPIFSICCATSGRSMRALTRSRSVGTSPALACGRANANASNNPPRIFFIQLSDTHWGFQGPAVNPDAAGTLPKAIAAVNALETQPDFVVFTGDLTHTTDDPRERRRRLAEFRDLARGLKNPNVRFMPGEHDAALDDGAAYQELFGPTHYAFDHKGVHFIALDNVSDRAARIGEEQLGWLKADLEKRKRDDRIVVLTHRPLFPLYPQWDWATRDGEQALELLMPYRNVVVFYGHIYQEQHYK